MDCTKNLTSNSQGYCHIEQQAGARLELSADLLLQYDVLVLNPRVDGQVHLQSARQR